jgi:hypothetical protein
MSVNYGETIGHWYLRLNGFFVLPNFVLHKVENVSGGHSPSDCDLLAIRFPHVYEEVGGQKDDWDDWLMESFHGLERVTCLIVQVKTGNGDHPGNAFEPNRLKMAIQRFGMFPHDHAAGIASRFAGASAIVEDLFCIGKLLIAERPSEKSPEWQTLTLSSAVDFIRTRMGKYDHEKVAHRMFFPSDLIQYFASQATHPHR